MEKSQKYEFLNQNCLGNQENTKKNSENFTLSDYFFLTMEKSDIFSKKSKIEKTDKIGKIKNIRRGSKTRVWLPIASEIFEKNGSEMEK